MEFLIVAFIVGVVFAAERKVSQIIENTSRFEVPHRKIY